MDRYLATFVGHIARKPEGRPHVTTLTRWKIACELFAAVAGVATVRAHHGARNVAAATVDSSHGAMPLMLRRPIHISAEAVGLSQHDLIDRILAAKSVRDVQLLAEKLA